MLIYGLNLKTCLWYCIMVSTWKHACDTALWSQLENMPVILHYGLNLKTCLWYCIMVSTWKHASDTALWSQLENMPVILHSALHMETGNGKCWQRKNKQNRNSQTFKRKVLKYHSLYLRYIWFEFLITLYLIQRGYYIFIILIMSFLFKK